MRPWHPPTDAPLCGSILIVANCKLLWLRSVHTDCSSDNDKGNERMGYIGPYGSVHMETCDKGNFNP